MLNHNNINNNQAFDIAHLPLTEKFKNKENMYF